MSTAYILTEDDLDTFASAPAVRAASNPNPAVLSAVLSYGVSLDQRGISSRTPPSRHFGLSCEAMQDVDSLFVTFESPLIEAVSAQLPLNVSTLLLAGANPNGLLPDMLSSYSTQFLRFVPGSYGRPFNLRQQDLRSIPEPQLSQIAPLTSQEMTERGKGITRFWTGLEIFPPWEGDRSAPTALEVAA